jgi:GH15 family glucan-1,4-alpha-glucosidase
MDKLQQSYTILDTYRLDHGLYYASSSEEYGYTWLRDNFFISLAFLDKSCNTYERTFWRMLDLFKELEWKINIHISQKPVFKHERIHVRYSAKDVKEIHDQEWAHDQNDTIGEFLWGIGEGIKRGKQMIRDEHDKRIIQKLVWYLNTLEYWNDFDAGYWEEDSERRSSSIASCAAGLLNVSDIVYVPSDLIAKGFKSLYELFPNETATRDVDLALLCLIYPYNLLPKNMAQEILHNVEDKLLTSNGVLRYRGDSYFSTLEKSHGRHHPKEFFYDSEGSWCMGFPWLSLCFQTIGELDKAKYYLEKTESVMLEDGSLPEIIMADGTVNPNTPLLWGNSLYIQAKEGLDKLIK